MNTCQYVISIVGGLVLGLIGAYINSRISKKDADKDSVAGIMGGNIARMAVDIAALAAVFFACRLAAVPNVAALLSTATGLAVGGYLMLRKLVKNKLPNNKEDGGE